MKGKRITEETMEKVKGLLMAGMYGYDVADACGVSIATVTKARRELMKDHGTMWHTESWLDAAGY